MFGAKIFEGSHLDVWDGVVMALYFIFIISVGIWSSRKSKNDTIGGYFLASRNMNWVLVGSSLFASNIGSGHFIGLSGSAAASGIAVAGFEIKAIFALILLGWFFIPVYMSSCIYTMPEYMRERFGGQRIRVYLSFLSLLIYIFTKISADLYAGALFLQIAMNKTSTEWLYVSILMLLAVAALFSIAGGLTAVIWTDFVQTVLMVLGALMLMVISFNKVGGYQALVEKYPYAIAQKRPSNSTCGIPPADYMNLLRSPLPGESDLPWTGMVFGLAVNSIWYWCTDQVIVQRTLASKDMIHAKGGCILVSYLKILPLWLLVFPGMIARVLYPDRVGCVDPEECKAICGNPAGCTNIAYIELVIQLLPPGLTGLMLSVMMAALMSSLTSIFNSASTIWAIDIWTRFRDKPSEMEMVIVGRMFVVVLGVISVIWIPVVQSFGDSKLFDYIQSISSFLAPPVSAVYILAIFWTRTNEPGAFWGLMIGLIIGMIRLALEFMFSKPSCGSEHLDTRPWFIILTVGNVHFLHFSCILFLITGLVTVCVSLLTQPIPEQRLHRLTFWTRRDIQVRERMTENTALLRAKTGTTGREETLQTGTEELSLCWSIWHRICGAKPAPHGAKKNGEPKRKITPEEEAFAASEFLYEEPKWKRFVNVNAGICVVISLSIWIYYA